MHLHILISILTAICALAAAVLYSADVQNVTTNQVVADGVETIVAQGFICTSPTGNVKCSLMGLVAATPPDLCTQLVVRIRRGAAVSGTVVSTLTLVQDSSRTWQPATWTCYATDLQANTSGAQYCLTATPTGAATTITAALIQTMVLSG